MRSILTIATLTFRESMRSKLVLTLVAAILLITCGMPFILDGDGTQAGLARMMLLYPLSVTFGFLAVNALWVSSSSIAGDVKNRTLQLVRVKPVKMWQLWFGKWIGLLFLFAVVLVIPFFGIHLRLSSGGALDLRSIKIAKELHDPELPSVESQVDEVIKNVCATQEMRPEEIRSLRTELMCQFPYAPISILAGKTWTWHFTLDGKADDRDLFLRLKLNTDSLSERKPVANCILRKLGDDKGFNFKIEDFSNREIEIEVPHGSVPSYGEIELVIANSGEDGSPSIMTQPRQWLHLMRSAGTIEANMARAYFVQLSVLALLLAVGLTAGSFFTLPVAVFTTTCLILTSLVGNYVVSDQSILEPDYTTPPPPIVRFQNAASAVVVKSISTLSAPALKPEPITHLSSSELIDDREILRATAGNFIALPALLALISSLYLARKELPE